MGMESGLSSVGGVGLGRDVQKTDVVVLPVEAAQGEAEAQ